MVITEYDKRFFDGTRGRIILLLRMSPRTVNELSAELGLTDNAVRSHLVALERDGLAAQGASVKGYRRPHFSYELTDRARNLFPKPYESLFNRLLSVLKRRMVAPVIRDILSELGRSAGKETGADGDLETRLARLTETLSELGGAARVIRENGRIEVKSESCPFADAVGEHPEMCKMAEALASEIVNLPVRETCDRSGTPKCSFEINAS
ncbi:MAG TPA: ArsR family transcriptional regulator [Pyrinomonadaceae bacterium]|nr:ArsR family transcriptional regulator [Pyrinomonadaceae bacterium]